MDEVQVQALRACDGSDDMDASDDNVVASGGDLAAFENDVEASVGDRVGRPYRILSAPVNETLPSRRIEPRFPDRCPERAMPEETVALKYDVMPDGRTTNIRVIAATNNCFVPVSVAALKDWTFDESETRLCDGVTKFDFMVVR